MVDMSSNPSVEFNFLDKKQENVTWSEFWGMVHLHNPVFHQRVLIKKYWDCWLKNLSRIDINLPKVYRTRYHQFIV